MVNVTSGFKTAISAPTRRGKSYIHIIEDNIDITESNYLQSISLEDFNYTDSAGFIGGTIAKKCTINIINDGTINLVDKTFELFMGILKSNDTYEYVSYGIFIIQKPQNTETSIQTTFTAYDNMIKFNGAYTTSLVFPKTLYEVLQDLCTTCGVELGETSIVNGDFIVDGNQFVNGELNRNVLQAISQISMGFAHIGRDNKLYIKFPEQDYESSTATGTDITLTNARGDLANITGFDGASTQATAILPSTYTQVDYLQSTGTQYINTGFIPNQDTALEINFISLSNSAIVGSRTSLTSNTFCLAGTSATILRTDYNTSNTNFNIIDSSKNIIKKDKNLTYLNGSLAVTQTYANFTCPGNLYLFAFNNNGTPAYGIHRVYNFKMWNNGVLIRNLVPCYRNSDNVIGMYDIVNSIFYTNSGTGTFTKGSNSVLPTPDFPIPICSTGDTGTINVWAHKKNLFDGLMEIGGINFTTGINEVNATRIRSVNYTSVIPNTNYVFKTTQVTGQIISVRAYGRNKEYLGVIKEQVNTVTFTTPIDCYYIRFLELNTILTNTHQLELGTTATTYEIYTGAEYPITLPSGYLGASLPNGVKDTATIKNVGKYVLDGINPFSDAASNNGTNNYLNANFWVRNDTTPSFPAAALKTDNNAIMCNRLSKGAGSSTSTTTELSSIGLFLASGVGEIRFCVPKSLIGATLTDNRATILSKFKTWLASNPVTVLYELATPVPITLALPEIATYQDYTAITTTNAVKPTLYVNYNKLLEISQIKSDNYFSLEKNQVFGPVNILVIKNSQVEGENVTLRDEASILLNGEHEFSVSDNPILYSEAKRTEVITDMFNRINGFYYTDFKTNYQGFPYLDAGDEVEILDKDNNSIGKTYLFNHTINYKGGFSGNIESKALTETETKYRYTSPAKQALKTAEIRVNKELAEINLEVSKKTDNDTIISSINLSPEEITINSGKIALEGYTTINDGFSVDLDGNMTCNNATMNNATITGGTILVKDNGSSSTIPGITIGDLYSGNRTAEFTCEGTSITNLATSTGLDLSYTGSRALLWAYSGASTNYFKVFCNNTNYTENYINFVVDGTEIFITDANKTKLMAPNGETGFYTDNNTTIITGGSINTFIVMDAGGASASNDLSDKRLKKNIKDSELNALNIISKIQHREFDFIDKEKHIKNGYIAQELEYLDNSLIRKVKLPENLSNGLEETYTLDTLSILSLATKAIQELNIKVDKLQEEINQLKNK